MDINSNPFALDGTTSRALSQTRAMAKSLFLVTGLAALAVTPWIEDPLARFLVRGAILSAGAVYFYHDLHHKRGGPFLSTEIGLPLWGKHGRYGTGRSFVLAPITDEDAAPLSLSPQSTLLTVQFSKTESRRRCWLCDLIQQAPTLPETGVMPKDFLTQTGDTFRFRYEGELVEATKSTQFSSNLAKVPPLETTLDKADRPASWTFLKESLVSTDAETLRLEPTWQRYKVNSDGSLSLHEDQILSDLFRFFNDASRWDMKAICQKFKGEEWPCYLMAKRLTRLEEIDLLIHRNRLLIAIPVPTPSASSAQLTLDDDIQAREHERNIPKYYYYDIEFEGHYSFTFKIVGENLEVERHLITHLPDDLT